MTEAERLQVRAETLEEVAHTIESDAPRYGRTLWENLADEFRSKASDARFRLRHIRRQAQHAERVAV